ncbi:MAG: chorismate synthase [Planctomycetota bacterium]
MEILGGPAFSVCGAGESHGPGVTTIVMGTPPGFDIHRTTIQRDLDRRRPGGNKHGTPRNEKDQVALLSGIYQPDHDALLAGGSIEVTFDDRSFRTEHYAGGKTTGEPIAALVLSTSKKSADYSQVIGPEGHVRPGHTDLVKHHQSRGFVDVRGGGRSSYRSTISDVVGGSIAREILRQRFGTQILSSIVSVGSHRCDDRLADAIWGLHQSSKCVIQASDLEAFSARLDEAEIPSLDAKFAERAADHIIDVRKAGDSVGAEVEIVAANVPPLLGSPLYQSLKLRLMGALGGLNAVQFCEVGDGREVTARRGSQNNDPIRRSGYAGNSHGGLIGGISTGAPLVLRVGFKPTSTIHLQQKSVRKDFSEIDFKLDGGRHDPCVGVRAGVTLESRIAIELLNACLEFAGKNLDGDWPPFFG